MSATNDEFLQAINKGFAKTVNYFFKYTIEPHEGIPTSQLFYKYVQFVREMISQYEDSALLTEKLNELTHYSKETLNSFRGLHRNYMKQGEIIEDSLINDMKSDESDPITANPIPTTTDYLYNQHYPLSYHYNLPMFEYQQSQIIPYNMIPLPQIPYFYDWHQCPYGMFHYQQAPYIDYTFSHWIPMAR